MINQRFQFARWLSLLPGGSRTTSPVLPRQSRTLLKRRTIDALTLLYIGHFGLDGGLLGGLDTFFVAKTGHGAIRLHDFRQNLDVILSDND